jgi:GNAT superfamily N-acetyltransferase
MPNSDALFDAAFTRLSDPELSQPPSSYLRAAGKMAKDFGQSVLDAVRLPGQVAGGEFAVKPETPGMWSEEDEYRQQRAGNVIESRAKDLAGFVTGGGYSAPAQRNATGMGIRAYQPPAGVELVERTPSAIDAIASGKNVGTINVSENNPFVSSVFVEPEFRGKGVGKSLYSAAEKRLGQDLVPSPLGLSDDAKKFWRKELAAMPPDEADRIVNKARDIGRGYGIKDADIDTRLSGLTQGFAAQMQAELQSILK